MSDPKPTPAHRTRRSPLFRLLENYVLDAIGHLSDDGHRDAGALVRAVFRTKADWRTCVREQFGLTPSVDAQLDELWRDSRAAAEARGADLTAREFATWVVDENFADTLEMLATEILGPSE